MGTLSVKVRAKWNEAAFIPRFTAPTRIWPRNPLTPMGRIQQGHNQKGRIDIERELRHNPYGLREAAITIDVSQLAVSALRMLN